MARPRGGAGHGRGRALPHPPADPGRLRGRASRYLGTDAESRERIRESVGEFYNVRSDIVHNRWDKLSFRAFFFVGVAVVELPPLVVGVLLGVAGVALISRPDADMADARLLGIGLCVARAPATRRKEGK